MRLFLQGLFILVTLLQRIDIEVGMDVAIGRRVHFLIVESVENAEETVAARAQQVIELLAKGRRQNLLRIAFADSRDGIGKEDTAPHDIHNVRQFRNLWVQEALGRDAGDLKDAIAEDALIGQIMNGIDGGSIGKKGIVMVDGMHPVRDYAGMPVVAVNDIRRPVQCAHCLQRAAAENDKTFPIIGIAIDVLAIKVARRVDHIDGNLIANRPLQYTDRNLEAVHIDLERFQHRLQAEAFGVDLPVAGHHQTHIVAQSFERLWQRAHHVCQTPNFRKWHNFSCEDQYSERLLVVHICLSPTTTFDLLYQRGRKDESGTWQDRGAEKRARCRS